MEFHGVMASSFVFVALRSLSGQTPGNQRLNEYLDERPILRLG